MQWFPGPSDVSGDKTAGCLCYGCSNDGPWVELIQACCWHTPSPAYDSMFVVKIASAQTDAWYIKLTFLLYTASLSLSLKEAPIILVCLFLDYEKAFDKEEITILWVKMILHGIDGRVLQVVKSMYSEAKSCVMVEDQWSDFFGLYAGVRQGENVAPLLFALFLNDFKKKDVSSIQQL